MARLSVLQVYQLARSVGLTHSEAITATAIAIGESGLRTDAVGDVGLQTSVWGPSVGLWQIRSLRRDSGTGRARDATRLKDPQFNARAMHEISNGGTSWQPWSVYLHGTYRQHLPTVRQAVGDGFDVPRGSPTLPGSSPAAIQLAGYQAVVDVTPWGLPLNPLKLPGWLAGRAREAGEDMAGVILSALAPMALTLLVTGAGLALIIAGLIRMTWPAFRKGAETAASVLPAGRAAKAAA